MKGEVALRTLYVEPAHCRNLKRGLGALEVSPLLAELILHILTTGMLDPGVEEHDRLAGVLIDLIAAARAMDLSLPLPRDARAQRLAERIRGEPAEKSDLETLAKTTGASLRTLQRHFSEETGLSIEAWRQKARLVHSAAALASGASVTDAAIDCGYDSPSAYISAFRKQFGVTPGRFKPE
jgi:AraC-like DNA-binding protein